jgi:mRNA interferase MazF
MGRLKRGDVVIVALQGDYGKPRPALVIQSDLFAEHGSVTILPITSDLRDAPLFRIALAPSPDNGLLKPSQIQVDRAVTIRRDKIGAVIGRIDDGTMLAVTRSLALFLGFG